MCGIFGIVAPGDTIITGKQVKNIADALFTLSESRGKESSGLAILSHDAITVYKSQLPASTFIHLPVYQQLIASADPPFAVIGHARLVTNGPSERNCNNQPVIKDGIVGIHNGIIVNDAELWKKFPSLKQKYEVDTEVLLSMTRHFLNKGLSTPQAIENVFRMIEGAASIAFLFSEQNVLILATNTGSLYVAQAQNHVVVFASERFILEQLIQRHPVRGLSESSISHIQPQTGLTIHLPDEKITTFIFNRKDRKKMVRTTGNKKLFYIVDRSEKEDDGLTQKLYSSVSAKTDYFYKQWEKREQVVRNLRRCTRCILPETMPFIAFNDNGVCNFCRNYQKRSLSGETALRQEVKQYRRKDGKPDCIVAFSGGRDSSFALHYVKKVLGLNPVAYSYDWGMLTDLGRRNQARMCGKLGVEHILISADIRKKRENIRKNVLAWLRKPDLGTIPLFMAGDKQYFYYANKLRKQMGIDLVIYSENPLEQTDFKYGFCRVAPKGTRGHLYDVGLFKKLQLASYYADAFLRNPSYINSSLLDTLSAYASSYFVPHHYLYLYHYIPWNENKINTILRKDYNWELADDTSTTWRIGDGTAAFYNYIYYTLAGFTENDTFRSNQVREGMITRDKALHLTQEDNAPRYKSLRWYCETVGININTVFRVVHSIPALFDK